jgi:hypothetical protein
VVRYQTFCRVVLKQNCIYVFYYVEW